MPTEMLKTVYNTDSKKKNNKLADLIKSKLIHLKKKLGKKMSKNEIKIERPDKLVDIVKKIFEFNRQNQEGQGLKALTPDQMLSRLAIALAQLKTRKT